MMLLNRRNSGQRGLLGCSYYKGEQNLPYDSQHDVDVHRSNWFVDYFLSRGKLFTTSRFEQTYFPEDTKGIKETLWWIFFCLLLQFTTELLARHNSVQLLSWKIVVKTQQKKRTTGGIPDFCKVVLLKYLIVECATHIGYDRYCFKFRLTSQQCLFLSTQQLNFVYK